MEETLQEVQGIYQEVSTIAERADMVGMDNRQKAGDLLRQVSSDVSVAQELQQVSNQL